MKLAAIDSETTGLDLAHGCKPFFVSACTEDGDITTWEWPVDPYTREPIIPKNEIVEVSDYLASYNPIFHNATFDLKALATIGVKGIYKAARRARDTTMAAHCFNSQQSLKLKDLCLKYLDILDDDEEELMRVIKKLRNSAKTLEWKVMDASVFPHRKRAPRGGWAPADMWIPKAYADHVLKESDEPKDQEKYKHYSTVLSTYAIRDAERTMALYLMFRDGLKHEGLWNHFVEQCGLIKVTHSIERKGIHIHRDSIPPTIQKYALIKHKYSQQAKKISDKVSSAPEKLNLRSPLQMSKFLFDDLELPVVIRTKPGNKRCSFCKDFLLNEETSKLTCVECNSKPSTNKEALLKLRDQVAEGSREHDFLTGVLVDRKIGKAIDYAQSYYDIAVGKKLYPNLNTNGTATTRCSMSNPNGQNVGNPEEDSSGIATELRDAGIDLRALFGPRKGRRWYALDYAQLQLRIFAFVSQEAALIKAFEDGWDAHSYMAHRIYNLPEGTQPSKQQRKTAKCFHPDTEVLTRTGWKKITSLIPHEEVMQAVPSNNGEVKMEWTIPTEVFTKENDLGHLIHLKNEGIDLRVTPDHRMLAWGQGKHRPPKVVMPEQLEKERHWANAGMLPTGKKEIDENLLRLAVITQADGSYSGNQIRFGFTKTRKIMRFRNAVAWAGIDAVEKITSQGVTSFTISAKDSTPIKSLLDGKLLPWNWLSLTAELRELVLDEAQFWDATRQDNWKAYRYHSTPQQNIDVMQALASITNRKTRAIEEGGCTNLTVREKPLTRGGNLETQRISHTGTVACLSVPSTFVLVRDKGVPVVTGQSVNFGFIFGARPAKIEATANKPGLWDDVTGMFPNAHKFILSTSKFIRKNGYITTTSGYRLYIPRHADGRRKDYAGVNYIVQGDEGIIVKRAMMACHKLINSNEYKKKHDAFITLQVHDELVFDVNRQDAEVSLIPEIAKCMEDAGKSLGFITPVDVDRIDKHWSKGVKLSL